MSHLQHSNDQTLDTGMAGVIFKSPRYLRTIPMDWHPLPLTLSTKKALMDSFSHYENFSYDETNNRFLVEVPVPPGRGRVPRAEPATLKNHVDVESKLSRSSGGAGKPTRLLEECYSWWLAQLIHYGLPLVLSTDEAKESFKNAILSGTLKVPANLKKMEQRMRNAISRRAKERVRRSGNASSLGEHSKNIKVETSSDDSSDNDDFIPKQSSRKRRKTQLKTETGVSPVGDSVSKLYSSNSETDSETASETESDLVEEGGTPARRTSGTTNIAKIKSANIKAQQASQRKTEPEPSRSSSSLKSSEDECQSISHDLSEDERKSTSDEHSDDEGDIVKSKLTARLAKTEEPDDDSTGGGSFSGDSEYERAVMSHAQVIGDAHSKYGDADTDESSESGYDNEAEVQRTHQLSKKKAGSSAKVKSHPSKSGPSSAFKVSTSKATARSTNSEPARSKKLEIKRDRKTTLKELEEASTCETTPSRNSKKRPMQDRQLADPALLPNEAQKTVQVYPGMTYEDVRDPAMRHKIARMRSVFPGESVHLCYVSLAKHDGNYDKGCEELVKATSTWLPEKPAPKSPEATQTTSSSQKRKRSNTSKQANGPSASLGKREDQLTPSYLEEPIVKQEPTPKRQKELGRTRRTSIISNDLHGSKIDLTLLNDVEVSTEAESNPPSKKRGGKNCNYKNASEPEQPSARAFQAVSVEASSSLAGKTQKVEEGESQRVFPSSPPTISGPKGILKSSPMFQPRSSVLNQTPSSLGLPSNKRRKRSADARSRKNSEPELPPQPPLGVKQQAEPHHRVSFGSYATESGWQALNRNATSKMRPSGQIEEEAQPEIQKTLFPMEKNRIVGLSRHNGGGLLQRGIVKNPSTSNSTSTKRKSRASGF